MAADPGRTFDVVFNFVYDPATLTVALARAAGERGANTRGVDRLTAADVEQRLAVLGFLEPPRPPATSGRCRTRPAGMASYALVKPIESGGSWH